MNPALVRFVAITAIGVGKMIYKQRKLAKSMTPTTDNNELALYVVSMINDGKVEIDEFDKIALAQLGIKVAEEEEA